MAANEDRFGETADKALLRRIGVARRLYSTMGDTISRNAVTGALLTAYQTAILRTLSLMNETGVVQQCARCADSKRGSCCFEEIGNEYDSFLLLINLLLGCDLPQERKFAGSCFFLGEKGCRLIARYHFCVNYLCPDLSDLLGREQSERLVTIVGSEISAGWDAELNVRRLVSHLTEFPDSSVPY